MSKPVPTPSAEQFVHADAWARLLPIACCLYLTITNLIWIARDNRPPFWDMAYHQTAAIRILDAFSEKGIAAIGSVPGLTGFYPPAYHSIVAAFYSVFGISPRVGQIANIPAVFILILATFGIARTLLPTMAAAAAAALIAFFPMMIWLSRAAMIDYWLTSLVALAMWLLLRAKGFTDRRTTILFGLVCGVGLLTKISFALFVVLPALWFARSHWKRATVAASIAAGVAALWYVPQWDTFMKFYVFNSASGVAEGDPPPLSWQSLLFYVRAVEGYHLFLPLFLLFCLAAILVVHNFRPEWIPLALWILGGWYGLLLLENKDPRYAMPFLPAVAIVTARVFERRPRWVLALLPFLLFQHFLVSFGVRSLPETVVLAHGPEGAWKWNWNLYSQSYAGLWGKPVTADWRVDDVLEKVTVGGSTVKLGLVPDIASFDLQAFEFEILRRRKPVTVNRIFTFDEATLRSHDYLLLPQEPAAIAVPLSNGETVSLDRYVASHPEVFTLMDSFQLPGGVAIQLFKTSGK
jgi:hypothetical protein